MELLDGGHDHAHGDEGKDPHVWLDPMRAKQEMKNIRDALVKADPGNVIIMKQIMRNMPVNLMSWIRSSEMV